MKGFGFRATGVVATGDDAEKIHGNILCIYEGFGAGITAGSILGGADTLLVASGCGRLCRGGGKGVTGRTLNRSVSSCNVGMGVVRALRT